ncbi:ATP adenylyltransferase-domain-containing protein [Armillaria luteobubalina]|uniref:ATP adenylyltransferase-domain-containing protein n=1 Tax=Armillaria luteobubalina TaxID=153913 RepID=A0AA39QM95_9AGAR|nr:ATP adenylyltransferase-domain-containing protein [Armillaria luteobubalina]
MPTDKIEQPSYNVIITLEHLHVIPRREENFVLQEIGDNLSVNTLGYAGMLLVKSERELETVKGEGARKILRGLGLESVYDLQVAGTSLEPEDDQRRRRAPLWPFEMIQVESQAAEPGVLLNDAQYYVHYEDGLRAGWPAPVITEDHHW